MKVILATGIFPPDIGGPATYTEKLAKEFQTRGIKTKVICYSDVKKYGNYKFPVIRISRKYPKIIKHFLYFLELLKLTQNGDVIYAQNPISVGFPSLLVSKILKKKLIVKVVGDAAWESYVNKTSRTKVSLVRDRQKFDNLEVFQKKKYDFFTEFIRKIQKFVLKNAEKIITPSQYLKNIICGWDISEGKVEVIYNAVEEIDFDILKEEAKKKIGIEGDIILSIGRLSPWKGFDALIDVFPDLLRENPDFKLVIVGEGEEKENLESRIKNLELEDRVKLIGKVDHKEIPFYFKAADIFILNSAYEGLSHVILEAMQFGVLVIASNKGGNPELIKDGFNGFLVEYNHKEQIKKAILKLYQDKNLAKKFIENSQERAKEFSWENLVEKTLIVLKST